MSHPIVIVGASLAGMAAAARLAKAGHRVVLLERTAQLGGRWTAQTLPPVMTFPAPWRDLFRKSGRAFDAELARAGLELRPAPAAVHVFADGLTFALPTDRGEQWTAITDAFGKPAATRWRDLLDDLDEQWQLLRRLGIEAEAPATLSAGQRRRLQHRTTIAELARRLDEPHLAELVLDVARRLGSDPGRTPGWLAVRLSLERTFGRWAMTRDGAVVPASTLIDLLAGRLSTRGVDVRLNHDVTAIRPYRVHRGLTSEPAKAVICATDPWTFVRLAGGEDRALRRRLRWLRPAPAPDTATAALSADERAELITHTDRGPVVRYRTAEAEVVHDFTRGRRPDPGYGIEWRGWRTWRRLPPLRAGTPMTFLASAASPGGSEPWAQLLSGALATYVVHEALTGDDIRPTNRALRSP